MTYPWPTLMPMGIVVISCVRPSVQPSMGLGLCIAYKALGRNGLQFGMLMYPDGLHSAFMDAYGYCCWSVCPSICPFTLVQSNHLFFVFFSKVRVGAKKGGSHYWEMAVAITCGYGGYLLPLLAAHSSFERHFGNYFVSIPGAIAFKLNGAGPLLLISQIMAWCRHVTSHYLNQCWLRPIMAYDITWPQRVNINSHWLFGEITNEEALYSRFSNNMKNFTTETLVLLVAAISVSILFIFSYLYSLDQ